MQGLELIKYIADLDRELAEKVAEAHRSASQKIESAEAESKRLLVQAEAQIRQMKEEAMKRIAEHCDDLAENALSRSAAETTQLRSQGLPNLDSVVEFILSKVVP